MGYKTKIYCIFQMSDFATPSPKFIENKENMRLKKGKE